jgi:hypothetical protein
MSIEIVVAHCAELGVKVYLIDPAELVVIAEGLHVPVMLLVDVTDKFPGVAF